MITDLRAEGISWAAIAAALGAQGVIEGKGDKARPITTSRLTAIVTQLRNAERRKNILHDAKAARSDLGSNSRQPLTPSPFALAEELTVNRTGGSTTDASDDEEALRRQRLTKLEQAFLKKDAL